MNPKLRFLVLPVLVALMFMWPRPGYGTPVRQSIIHTVQAGETLSGIAARYGVSQAALQSANQITNSNRIYVGMRLTIPTGSPAAPSSPTPAGQGPTAVATTYPSVRPAGGCGSIYIVQPGDTLYGVAARCQVSATALASANRLGIWAFLFTGQRLQMPSGSSDIGSGIGARVTATSTASCATSYRVQAGDTLSAIALRCGSSVEALRRLNRLSSDVILTGQTLTLRGNPEPANQWLPLVTTSTQAQAATPSATMASATLTPALTAAQTASTPTPAIRPSPTPRIEPTIRP